MGGNISSARSHENLQLPDPEDTTSTMQKQVPVVNRSPSEQPGMAAGGLGGAGHSPHEMEEHGAAHEGAPAPTGTGTGEHTPAIDEHK
jgi:hypothetical protein